MLDNTAKLNTYDSRAVDARPRREHLRDLAPGRVSRVRDSRLDREVAPGTSVAPPADARSRYPVITWQAQPTTTVLAIEAASPTSRRPTSHPAATADCRTSSQARAGAFRREGDDRWRVRRRARGHHRRRRRARSWRRARVLTLATRQGVADGKGGRHGDGSRAARTRPPRDPRHSIRRSEIGESYLGLCTTPTTALGRTAVPVAGDERAAQRPVAISASPPARMR